MTTFKEFPQTEDFHARARRIYQESPLLGKERYTSRTFFELERERMWRRTWQLVCRESEVSGVGDYLVHEVGGESILVIREAPDRLRALSNVCRHRGTHLKREKGTAQELRCPFHGWRYGFDGQLLEIPNDWDFPHVDAKLQCLPEFRVDTWQGFVFVNLDHDAPPLEDFLSPIPELFAPFNLRDFFRMFAVRIVIPCNWKLAYAAFIESYHSPWTHPTTIQTVNDALTDYELFGDHGRMIVRFGPSPHLQPPLDDESLVDTILEQRQMMGGGAEVDADRLKREVSGGKTPRQVMAELRRVDASARGADISFMNESQVVDTWAYNIFPNMIAFTSLIGLGFYSRFAPNGDDPDSSIMEVCLMMPVVDGAERPPDVPFREIATEEIPEALGAVGLGLLFDQDVRNLRTVQQGLKSAYLPGITLGLYQEALPHHFEEVLDRYLARP